MMSHKHPQDCIVCRARALGCTPDQIELIVEALSCGIAAGWKERGLLDRTPTDLQTTRMMMLAHSAWVEMFGTGVPESAEVADHRHRSHGGDR